MARSALLQAIQRLAEEHRSADRLGIDPAELRGRRHEADLLAPRVPEAGRHDRSRGRGGRARPALASRERGDGAADRDRRRRDRGPHGGVDARRRGCRVDRLRSIARPDRRPDALGPLRLLEQRPGLGVLRRADRQRSRDHPAPRPALPPRHRRPGRRAAERLDRHELVPRRLLLDRAGGQGLPADPQHPSEPGQGDRLSDHLRRPHRRGSVLRPDDGARLDRPVRPRRPRLADGPAARLGLQRGVRSRDERPGSAEPHLPARLPGVARELPSSASPTSGTTSWAATSSCPRRSRPRSGLRT